MTTLRCRIVAQLLCLALAASVRAGEPYVENDVAVPMRDGVVLRGDVFRPSASGRFPTLVYRTPYDRKRAPEGNATFGRAVARGYAVVIQDVRGRYGSAGEFRPYQQEGEDGYDTIEWAAAQPWSDGAVGSFGLSYPGAVQWLAAVESPPHLKAMVPAMTFSTPDNFFHSGGSFDLSWIDWIWQNIAPDTRLRKGLAGPRTAEEAAAEWRRRGLSLKNRLPLLALDELREVAPYYFEWLRHPTGDPWWEWCELRDKYARVGAAVLNISGWHDEAYGPEGAITNFLGLLQSRRGQPDPRTQLVLGPWVHGGIEQGSAGQRAFGDAARLDYAELVLRFLDRHVRGLDVDTGPPVRVFVMGENAWREAPAFPLPGTRSLRLHLVSGGRLTTAAPRAAEDSSAFVSDPSRPVEDPFAGAGGGGAAQGAHDYRELARRPDVLSFESEPLAEDLRVVGRIRGEILLSTDAKDVDLWLKLYDVAPDGTAFNLMSPGLDVVRASYRDGGPEQKLLSPGQVYALRFENLTTANLFKRGHRLGVVLAGSFAPHFSRNLQTGESEVTSSASRPATLRIHHDAARLSRIELPILADEPPAPLGFAEASAHDQRALEARLATRISPERIAAFHKALTQRPHVAGTDGGQAVAATIERLLREMGLSTERRSYQAFLSYPKRVRVALARPVTQELPTGERSDPLDPDTSHAELMPGFVAYSASGRVQGPVVYANYGLPADYAALDAAGVRVAGGIVLARYGKVHRAVKVHGAESRGARGIVIYSDPADDGYAQGDPWPKGPWRAPWFLQRGNAKYSWHWHGDPLTPFVAATADAQRLSPGEAPTLPRIPAAVLSWSAAQEILSRLRGPTVPPGFQGGLPFAYHVGPGPAEVELDVEMDAGLRPITNVLARIEGSEEPDRVVLLGTHHDAWTFGGVDPGSSGAAILELARALSDLRREGWRPRRSLVLAFWDAEEYGLIGSTEHAEEQAETLREQAVAYLNSDLYRAGRLETKGTISLRDLVAQAAGDVAHPSGEGTLGPGVAAELEPLGSGADFVPFQMFLGLPSLSLEFGPLGGYGSYHSAYDTRRYMERHGDPGWLYGRALAELLGRVVLRLACAEVLPLRPSKQAAALARSLDALGAAPADLAALRASVGAFQQHADRLEAAVQESLTRGWLDDAARRAVSDAVAGAEKAFVDADPQPPGAPPRWYRHILYGWDIYALYAGDTLPALRRALAGGDRPGFERERARLERAVNRATAALALGRAALSPGRKPAPRL